MTETAMRASNAGPARGLDRAIVVTGASTGIGRAAVEAAVRNDAHVFAGVRKIADANALKREFGAAVTPLLLDVTDESAVRAAAGQVAEALGSRRLFGLVNNAGIAVSGPLLHLSNEEVIGPFDVNLFGVHRVTRAFAPLVGADDKRTGAPGRIVMISSEGGQRAMPFTGAYCASKFALEGYSEALRREMMLYGVDVIIVGPGAISTPIWDKAANSDFRRFDDTDYASAARKIAAFMRRQNKDGLPPVTVGELIWRTLTAKRPKIRYAILRNAFTNRTLLDLLPTRFLDRVIAKRLGLTSQQNRPRRASAGRPPN